MPLSGGPNVTTREPKVRKPGKSSLKVKLPVKIPERMAKNLLDRSSEVTATTGPPTATTTNTSPRTIDRTSLSSQDGAWIAAERRKSKLLDARERKIRAQEEYLNSSKEEYDLLQQSSRDTHEEILRLKAELARALVDKERQADALNLKYQEREKQIKQQIEEITNLRGHYVKYQGLKRKLAKALSEDEVVKEDSVSTTEPLQANIPMARRVTKARKVRATTASHVSTRLTEGSSFTRTRSPALGTLHNPWMIPDDERTDDGTDDIEDTITVRVATKSEPNLPSTQVTAHPVISSSGSETSDTAEGTESETASNTESETQDEESETTVESSSDVDNSEDSDWDPQVDNIGYTSTWLPGMYA